VINYYFCIPRYKILLSGRFEKSPILQYWLRHNYLFSRVDEIFLFVNS
jgi:hypothetical protein